MEQLGNAAAGVFAKFGRETKVDLLMLVPALVEKPAGSLSPGGGFRAQPLAAGRNKFLLQEYGEGSPSQAKPVVTYTAWKNWIPLVESLPVIVLLERPLSARR
jgi:hypothetical protein